MIGHVGVDFVTLQEEGSSALRLWAVDADFQPTPSLASYQLFDFLTVGNYNPASECRATLCEATKCRGQAGQRPQRQHEEGREGAALVLAGRSAQVQQARPPVWAGAVRRAQREQRVRVVAAADPAPDGLCVQYILRGLEEPREAAQALSCGWAGR